nr:hypothetical protein [Tanacetum cinerariifolium]
MIGIGSCVLNIQLGGLLAGMHDLFSGRYCGLSQEGYLRVSMSCLVEDAETGADSENTNSETETKILSIDEDKGEETSNTVALEEKTVELDAVQIALQAPLHERFRDLLEADMKEILHQQMFESGSYRLHSVHEALYEALEASMDHDNRDEFFDATAKPKTPEPDWVIPPNDLPKPENNWADAIAKSYKDPEENKLLQETKDMGSFIKWFCRQIGKTKLNKDTFGRSCFQGHRVVSDVSKPLPLGGSPGQKKMMRETDVHKFSDGTLNRILDKLDYIVKDFKLFKYNSGIEIRIWSEDDRRKSKEFKEVIEARLKIRRNFRSLKSFGSGRLRDVVYRLIQRTE